MTIDVSHLTPSDAVAALRSFPRRFRGVTALADDEDEELLHRPGPDGRSVADHVELAARDLALLADAVRRTLDQDRPPLHPAVVDAGARDDAHQLEPSLQAALDLLTLEAGALADRAEHVPAGEWSRTAEVAGHGDVPALDVLRDAVATTAAHLRAADAARIAAR